jgi:Holliday junction resolvase RusA-like endonuclease
MANIIEFEFLEPPMGKERPRTVFKHNRYIVYTPQNTRTYEKRLGICVYSYMLKNKIEKFKTGIPLKVCVKAFFKIPSNARKITLEKMKAGEILPTLKPDADNIVKIILDALNKTAFEDDCQVCEIEFVKKFSLIPKITVRIEEIECNTK